MTPSFRFQFPAQTMPLVLTCRREDRKDREGLLKSRDGSTRKGTVRPLWESEGICTAELGPQWIPGLAFSSQLMSFLKPATALLRN